MLSVTRTILLSENGVMALNKLIMMKKAEKPHFTKNFIAKKIGLKSRGYLSDILSGRKKVSARYVNPIVETIGLESTEASYLSKKLMLETELAKTPMIREELEADLTSLEKTLRWQTIGLNDVGDIYSLCLVYLCFFLKHEKSLSQRDLIATLPMISAKKIEHSIAKLMEKKLLIRNGSQFSVNPDKEFSFANSDLDINQELQYLEQSIDESKNHLPQLKSKRDQVLFHSSLLTTDKETLIEKLSCFKEQLRNLHSDLETDNADSLIRFNLQIYPLISQPTR